MCIGINRKKLPTSFTPFYIQNNSRHDKFSCKLYISLLLDVWKCYTSTNLVNYRC